MIKRKTANHCHKIFGREDGAIAAWFAISIPIFIGFAALAVEMSYGFTMRNKTQITASSAALAGAAMLPDANAARDEALDFAALNMPGNGLVLDANDVLVGNWVPETRSFTNNLEPFNAVRVTTRLSEANDNPITLFFSSFFGHDTANINTPAIAVNGGGEPQDVCLLSLEPTEPDGIYINGNNTITSNECGICINSSNDAALRANGTPTIDVGDDGAISVHGGISETPNVSFNPPPTTGQPPCDDPYAAVTAFDDEFANNDCSSSVAFIESGNKEFTFPEGVHCDAPKLVGNWTVNFDPGIHHFIDTTFDSKGNGTITGIDITILLSNTKIDWAGAKDFNLTAGPSGFVFFQDPSDPPGNKRHKIGGNADAVIDGIQYFGMQDVWYHGTTQQGVGGAPICSVIVARTFEFNGTVDMTLDASSCSSDLPEVNASTLALRLVD
jgi:Flp pilus assembly protein TadG